MTPSPADDNQVLPLTGGNAWRRDALLIAATQREGGGWVAEQADALGAIVAGEAMADMARLANRHGPELRTHDPAGRRIDRVDYHPAYHKLMGLAFRHGLHSLAWTAARSGRFVARAALNYLWNQAEQGTACPVTMSFAAVHILRQVPALARVWEPKLLANDYDPRPLPLSAKKAVTIGMAMTEKQGGSDLRATQTVATPEGAEHYRLEGHKWFCSAPMSDGFFTLARLPEGVSCFFVPRALPDGSRNPFLIQRLKDKCGNRSNASAEIEYRGTLAWPVGAPGRGIATLIEMAHLTRFDIVVASAAMQRAAVNQALHHAAHRRAFGARLIEQPLMRNVLADLALEAEAALLLAFRLARAFDAGPQESFVRCVTPIAKYWLAKRTPMVAAEAMECLGGNGYVEELPLARLYREAPLNSIWEGSGNVICLDALRALQRAPEAMAMLQAETAQAAGEHPLLRDWLGRVQRLLADPAQAEIQARLAVEMLALGLQAALLLQHAPGPVADAFCRSRLGGEGGRAFGTLPADSPFDTILARLAPA